MTDDLTEEECRVLRRMSEENAYWTSDIAYDARMPTAKARRILARLEAWGEVERVVLGNPTSWRIAKPSGGRVAKEIPV